MDCSVGILLKYHCYSKMYKFVGPSEVISSKQRKICYQKQTNRETKQTNRKTEQAKKYQKERKKNMNTPFINLT